MNNAKQAAKLEEPFNGVDTFWDGSERKHSKMKNTAGFATEEFYSYDVEANGIAVNATHHINLPSDKKLQASYMKRLHGAEGVRDEHVW